MPIMKGVEIVLLFWDQWKMISDLNIKNAWFCFISIVWVHFSHETEKLWFWKTLKYFNILKNVWRHILICPMKKHPILFHSIVWVHLSHKTEKLWFWKSLKYFNIFWWKNILCQIWICPMEKCLTLFYFYYLGSL